MGNVIKTVVGVALTVVGFVVPGMQWLIPAGISLTLSGMAGMLTKSPKQNQATGQRLSKNLDPEAFRKIVFGRTAGGCDIRYWEVYGTGDTQYDEVIAVAGHKINSFKELYIESNLTCTGGGAASGKYTGSVTQTINDGTVGNAALSAGSGSYWNTNSKFRGSAHYVLKWTYDQKKLPNGIPSQYVQVVEGALVYDPRKDSTVGGSGTHRYNDQTTWQYSPLDSNGVPIGRNNALQVLWYLLGWTIQDTSGNNVLVAGRGVNPGDIDFAAFIAAANDAEAQHLYTDCILSTGDSHQTNESILTGDGVIGALIDPGGMWTYKVNKNDTASIDVALTDDDVVDTGTVTWTPTLPMSQQYNAVVGTFIDPSTTSLYQAKPYPDARNTTFETNDGFKKRKTLNFQAIQDGTLAAQLAMLVLNESRWQGQFTAKFNYNALKTQLYGIVTLSLKQYGFVSKLFRVLSMIVETDGVTLRLNEVDPSIWAGGSFGTVNTGLTGGNGTTAGVVPLTDFALANSTSIISGGTYPGIAASWSTLPITVKNVQLRYRKVGDTLWIFTGSVDNTHTSVNINGLASNCNYEVQWQTYSTFNVPSGWSASYTLTTGGYVAPPTNSTGSLLTDGDFSGGTGTGAGSTMSGSWTRSSSGIVRAVSS